MTRYKQAAEVQTTYMLTVMQFVVVPHAVAEFLIELELLATYVMSI